MVLPMTHSENPQFSDLSLIKARMDIAALSDRFGRALDDGDLALFLSIFTDDVDYRNGPRHLRGKSDLEAFFNERKSAKRVSRHFYSGLIVDFTSANEATGLSTWLTFAGTGTLPLADTRPFLVADACDHYRRSMQGAWLISQRIITPIFRNIDIPPPSTTARQS